MKLLCRPARPVCYVLLSAHNGKKMRRGHHSGGGGDIRAQASGEHVHIYLHED